MRNTFIIIYKRVFARDEERGVQNIAIISRNTASYDLHMCAVT